MSLFSAKRLRVLGLAFILLYLLLVAAWLFLGKNPLSPEGNALGSDFSGFYAAGKLAAGGEAAKAYDPQALAELEKQIPGHGNVASAHLLSAPSFLPALAPLAKLNFPQALAAFSLCGFLLCLAVCLKALPRGLTALLFLAAPASALCLLQGQNTLLLAGLMALGFALLRSCPFLGGLVLGLASFKPHLAWIVPLTLLAGGERKALAGYVLGLLGLAGLCMAMFSGAVWTAFFKSLPQTLELARSGALAPHQMPTLRASLSLLGLEACNLSLYQAVFTTAVAALVCMVWLRGGCSRLKGAVLLSGTLLAAPLAFDCDMALTLPALAFSAASLLASGKPRFWPCLLAIALIWPLISSVLAAWTNIQLGLAAPMAAFCLSFYAWRKDVSAPGQC